MFSIRGNTSVSVFSPQNNLPTVVTGYSVVNKSASTVYVNVYLLTTTGLEVNISPFSQPLASGEMLESTNQVVMLATEQIKITPSGSVDYNVTFENL